jgi:hypothetical protein
VRWFTRLALGFSEKFENHCHMVAPHTVRYNFVMQHKSLKGPGDGRGRSKTLWSVGDIVALIEKGEAVEDGSLPVG